MGVVQQQTRLREDAVIGLVFTTFFAAGVLIISIFPTTISLQTIVFGNILGISNADIVQMRSSPRSRWLILGLKWKDLMVFAFDENQARASGSTRRCLKVLF